MAEAERVVIDGETYLVCACCRYPTELGKSWSPVFPVPQPGIPVPGPKDKQAVCTECYLKQYSFIYPEVDPPSLPDGRHVDLGRISWGQDSAALPQTSEYALWQQAIERSKASAGAETVPQAYAYLSGVAFDVDSGEHNGLAQASRP